MYDKILKFDKSQLPPPPDFLKITDEQLKAQDNGAITHIGYRVDSVGNKSNPVAIFNIFPYRVQSITWDQFDEWFQFMRPDPITEPNDHIVMFKTKHWSEI